MTGESPEIDKVANRVFNMWSDFMKSGDPCSSVQGFEWKTYGRDRNTLVIDEEFRIAKDFNSSLRKAWERVEPRIPGNL